MIFHIKIIVKNEVSTKISQAVGHIIVFGREIKKKRLKNNAGKDEKQKHAQMQFALYKRYNKT